MPVDCLVLPLSLKISVQKGEWCHASSVDCQSAVTDCKNISNYDSHDLTNMHALLTCSRLSSKFVANHWQGGSLCFCVVSKTVERQEEKSDRLAPFGTAMADPCLSLCVPIPSASLALRRVVFQFFFSFRFKLLTFCCSHPQKLWENWNTSAFGRATADPCLSHVSQYH